MNRICLFLCFLCIPWVARGQSAYNWVYWFDSNHEKQHSGTTDNDAFSIAADTDGLSEGLHEFHVQVADTAGKYSPPRTQLFYYTADHTIKTLRYWFDNDFENILSTPTNKGQVVLDVSHLDPGIHFIYCQIEDASGKVSDVYTQCFYRQLRTTATSWTYWFDEDETSIQTMNYPGEAVLIDVSALSEGFHTIHNQLSEHSPSDVVSKIFIKIPQTDGVGTLTCICAVDEKLVGQAQVPSQGGIISWQMDVDSLDVGMHRAMFQAITPTGVASTIAERYFVRVITDKELSGMKCVYSLDNFQTFNQAGTLNNGLFHFDLDVAAMEDGLHHLSYMLVSEQGVTTTQHSAFFWKVPLGGEGIVQYDYWVNNNDDQRKSVQLAKRVNPLSLISLLPVESQPIRSCNYQFAIKNGSPLIYARNEFHIRFFDANGRYAEESKEYVDEQVSEAVTNVTPINDGDRKTMAVPEANGIHWFKFYAEEGDTVTFRTSQAATLQVFSPEGKEVYSAQGSTSVKHGGCHTWVDGIYYVALHDVTGSKPNISLDFTHLSKYDVVNYDVATVGNGGCSTITFKGNGFNDLYAVDFISAANDSIHSFSIGHESDGTTSVTADFTDAELGKYTALFHFTGGKKYVFNAITVEEAKAIELATEVTFPSSFGHVVTYTCKITNNGNMTAYAVPIYTWLKSKRLNGIYNIKYEGLDLDDIIDYMDADSLSSSDMEYIKSYNQQKGDDHYFFKFWTEDEDHPGDSVVVRSNYFYTNIAPHETKILRLTISTREVDAFAYFTVPEEWVSYSIDQYSEQFEAKARFASRKAQNWYCCYRDRIECIVNIVVNGLDIASLLSVPGPTAVNIASCVAGSLNQVLTAAGDTYCGTNDVEGDFMKKVNKIVKGISVTGALASCASALGVKGASEYVAALDGLLHPSATISCLQAFLSKKPDCPPIPPGGGGAQGGKSHDPNEIYGYMAESGSKFMTDEVENVNYRIEFENDTAFATRSAMVVEIRDTLDSNLFDLDSYAPTGIKIGEKVEYLDGEQTFIRTIDMRPEINGLVEVEGKYDANKGIMSWLFTSIDPMTMEPTNDPMEGFLPVNTNGQGIGEVSYDIKLKQKMAEGTVIPNRASIVFDINEPILTPTWKNTIDATAPVSHITDVRMHNDSTAAVSIEATDELSGPWRYDVYVQYGNGATWLKAAENVPAGTVASVKVYEGIDHGFYVIVTDSAGNVEAKDAAREFSFEVFAPQVDTETKIELAQGWNWISHNQQDILSAEALKPKAQRIVSQTDELYKDERIGWTGSLCELTPTEMYKVQMAESSEVQLSGRLFNAAFRTVPLYEGWNWIGYPVAMTMTPAEALQRMDAEEGDFIVGQDGMATFTDGQWTGTLLTMEPGRGYMYRSVNDKNLFLNATAQYSVRRNVQAVEAQEISHYVGAGIPDVWSVDKHKYQNVMGIVANLYQKNAVVSSEEWLVAAFCGEECRGVSQTVDGHLMMNVYGTGGERITFLALHRESGEVVAVEENELFRTDILGSMQQPYAMHSGVATGIYDSQFTDLQSGDAEVYDLQGRRIVNTQSPNRELQRGVYIVNDQRNKRSQKVLTK